MALSELYADVYIPDNELSTSYLSAMIDETLFTSEVVTDVANIPILIDELIKL